MNVDARAVLAAQNNADLYEAVFDAHGLSFERLAAAFVGKDRPPPFYSNLTVVTPSLTDEIVMQVKELADRFDGKVGLKDSFCQLDLAAFGFRILFTAQWIWRENRGNKASSLWQKVENDADLLRWESAWKEAGSATEQLMFPSKLLQRPEIHLLGHKVDGVFETGCIVNTSADCIGLSNVFSRSPSDRIFADAAAAAEAVDPKRPIVGYESGESLRHAIDAGFETVGDLRILVADAASL